MIKRFKENMALLMEEISIPEYILWWMIRVCMILHIKHELRPDRDWIDYVLPYILFALTFIVFILRTVLPRKATLAKLSFKTQTFTSCMVFFGTFVGNFFDLYGVDSRIGAYHYDWILHAISGVIITMLGYYFITAMNLGKPALSPKIATLCSVGFSFTLMVVWEMIEFFGDFLWGDMNQKYNWTVQEFDPFYPILSTGEPGPAQYPVFDTNIDMLLALLGTFLTAIILYIVLTVKDKKKQTRQALEVDLTAQTSEATVALDA